LSVLHIWARSNRVGQIGLSQPVLRTIRFIPAAPDLS
jgi:hypothetical protein